MILGYKVVETMYNNMNIIKFYDQNNIDSNGELKKFFFKFHSKWIRFIQTLRDLEGIKY